MESESAKCDETTGFGPYPDRGGGHTRSIRYVPGECRVASARVRSRSRTVSQGSSYPGSRPTTTAVGVLVGLLLFGAVKGLAHVPDAAEIPAHVPPGRMGKPCSGEVNSPARRRNPMPPRRVDARSGTLPDGLLHGCRSKRLRDGLLAC